MRWTIKAVDFWIDYYNDLKEYRINPWKEIYYEGEVAIKGKHGHKSPTEAISILNAEFDLAVKKLTEHEQWLFEKILRGEDVYEERKIRHKIARILIAADKGEIYLVKEA